MAEEGLTGTLSSNKEDVIGCYGDNSHCTDKEVKIHICTCIIDYTGVTCHILNT